MSSQEDIYNEFRRISKQTYTNESSHLEDLWSIPVKSHPADDSEYKIEADGCHLQHITFLLRAAFDVVLTLLTDWTLPFKHPLYWLYLVFVYPVALYILFVAEVISFIVDKLELKFVKASVYERWSKYTAPELLFNAEFFQKDENRSIVDEGVGALDKSRQEEAEKSDEYVQHFNLDIAQFLLFISDVIYYRSSEKILEAKQKIDMIKHRPEKRDELLREIVGLLQESDEIIKAQAKKWKLKFTSVSELNTLGESYAGIFYSERHDFIVVAFKGPTIEKFESFVRGLLFQHVDGRPITGFGAYNGYRSMLHPETERPGPYATIVEAIRNVVRVIRERSPEKKINIWVTGHSLGGTLATMFYTRCLKSPSDLGEHCVLRDAYVFGSPCVGDSELASTYASSLSKQSDVVSTLWRVLDDKDIITSLPFGFYHPGGVGKYNMLDKVHIGEAVKFYQDQKTPVLVGNPLIPKKNPVPTITSSKPREKQFLEIPIHSFDEKLPSFIRDHTTSRYLLAMSLARNHLVDSVKGSTESKGYHGEITLAYES